MVTELLMSRVKEDDLDFPPIPPGFEGFTSFSSQRAENKDNAIGYSIPLNVKFEPSNSEPDREGEGKKPSLRRHRPSINYGQMDISSDGESDFEQISPTPRPCLPKGVVRGCPECQTCQKVTARWRPEAASRPELEDVPAFYPNEEEFQDPIKYIEQIRPKAEAYGICRIIPPPSWKPTCLLKEKSIWEHSKFSTRIQRVDKLQNRGPTGILSKLRDHLRKKRRRCSGIGEFCRPSVANLLVPVEAEFGFEPGPEFSLEAFQRYAEDFKVQYFRKAEENLCTGINSTQLPEKWEPSVETLEGEYWRMVEKPTEEIEVLYGADLETGVFGSGFPKVSGLGSSVDRYVNSGWNLNNLSRLPGSVLSYESADISGVQVPWLYIGMCFSSFCWHVEDHHLYSLNYLHFGALKVWYGVPGKAATNLEQAMRKHLPDLFEEQPDLLHKLVTQLSPTVLQSEGVPVYRCIQNPGEFVLTFPRAYHSGFNCGFNCAEAVNVAPLDWFPHGQNAVELYCEQGRKTTISHDKLLLGAAREAVKAHWELNFLRKNNDDNLKLKDICGKDGVLAKSLRARVRMEEQRRELLYKSSKVLKMESGFDATTERECSICFFDLHLSAAGCRCSSDKVTCLVHAKQLCSCAWADKFFLLRYETSELNLLLEAVEGKLSAVYRWAKLDLGLALSSEIVENKIDATALSLLSQQQEECEERTTSSSSSFTSDTSSRSLTAETKLSAIGASTQNVKQSRNKLLVKKDGLKLSISGLSTPPHLKQFQKGVSPAQSSTNEKPEVKNFSYRPADVICLSDDEDNESQKVHLPLPDAKRVSPVLVDSNEKSSLSHGEESASFACSASTENGCGAKCEEKRMADPEILYHQSLHGSSAISKSGASTAVINTGNRKDDIDVSKRETEVVEEARRILGNPSCSQSNLDNYYRQKGPRIAKVVRKINCIVEPLDLGIVQSGKLWCTSQAIFPKGFRSRVRYIDFTDPTNLCFYVSEIINGGNKGPLFMVSKENCSSEVFAHVSPVRCWDMGIEALDKDRTCKEYWLSRPLAQVSQCSISKQECRQPHGVSSNSNQKHPADGEVVLGGFFKKANMEELHSLLETLGKEMPEFHHSLPVRLIREEIQNRS
ncbi:putative lysine-specific demethylase JMJ16 [Drosera capensis]